MGQHIDTYDRYELYYFQLGVSETTTKGVLRNFAKFTRKHPCQRLFFNKIVKKESLAQVFSCESCEISMNTFFYRTPSYNCRSSSPEAFCEGCVLRNFTKFIGRHLCQSLFFNKVAGPGPQLYSKRDPGADVFL